MSDCSTKARQQQLSKEWKEEQIKGDTWILKKGELCIANDLQGGGKKGKRII